MSVTINPIGARLETSNSRLNPRQRTDLRTIALFLTPAFIFYFLFIIFPILQAIYVSFFQWKGFGAPTNFVGLDNYAQILGDKYFIRGVINALLIVALSIGVQLPLALTLALMVGRRLPGRAFFRTVFFLPYVLSEVMAAIIWLGMFNPDPTRGFLNGLLLALNPTTKAVAWLGNLDIVMISIFMALTWKYFGLHLLLFMAGLQNIPREVEEAAAIDGASTWQTIRYITIPMIASTIRLVIYLSVLGALSVFALVWIMTQGGPAHASETMATYMYKSGFVKFQFGYGSAVAMLMFVMCLAFSVVYQRLVMRKDYEGAGGQL
ncbi:Diacetylchitobiose uptake system permease protein NgcF [Anaerolineae bacterium]|nr:Diacetylchitobiose uptake system permease protein NgcF [Anaerolineae bacterium]